MLVYNIERRVYMYFHPTPVSFFFNSIFCLFYGIWIKAMFSCVVPIYLCESSIFDSKTLLAVRENKKH